MKKTNFTNQGWNKAWLFALVFLTANLFSVNNANAQCTLVANDLGYISLDSGDCISEVTADMILESPQSCPGAIWQVIVYKMDGTPLHIPADNVITQEQIGQTVLVQVMDLNSGNMTPKIPMVVLDKAAPYFLNYADGDTLEMYCPQMENFFPIAYDACDLYGAPEYWVNYFHAQNNPIVGVNVVLTNETEKYNPCLTGDDWPSDDILRIVDRTYVAFDSSGNYSDPLHLIIKVLKIPANQFGPNSAIFRMPPSRTVAGQNPISCADDFESTVNGCCEETGCPTPAFAGVPTMIVPTNVFGTVFMDTTLLYPSGYLPCNLTVSYLDLPLNNTGTGCVKTFKRFWTIRQWSCGITDEMFYVQTIEVADKIDPVLTCLDHDVTITTNSIGNFGPTSLGQIDCGASYMFPVPGMSDLCAPTDQLEWDITVFNDLGVSIEFIDNANPLNPPFRVLPLGENTVQYTVSDPCGNSSTCEFKVNVEDHTAPIAVCQQFTTVALTYDGKAEVFAHSFDSGSYDDCQLDRFEVKRMDNGVPCGLATGDGDIYKDYVTFCCADVGKSITVLFKVWDHFNNSSECMVQVTVQDKLAPIITCPPNMEVNCDFFYDTQNLDAYFGEPTAYDNCEVTFVEDTEYHIDQCGLGYILRHFTATDPGLRTAKCTQRIDFINRDPFWINQLNPNDLTDDVEWPETFAVTGCMNPADLHPDVTGWPKLLEGPCDLAGPTWKDDVYLFNDDNQTGIDACFKIIRHWKVIDWCQKDVYNNGIYKTWDYDQVIMVSDPEGPTITTPCVDLTACTYECDNGYIELSMSAFDLCTENEDLRWNYKIDFNNDNTLGSFDYESKVLFGANVQALGPDLNGIFPVGQHRIYWTVWDQCGNKSNCEYEFTIMNCKKPTPYCLDHISTTLMNMGNGEGMVQVKATDCAPCCLDAYHPCGYKVVVSFSKDINDTIRTYTCDNIGFNNIEVWATAVWPDGTPMVAFGETLQDFCTTKVDIQDNSGVCNGSSGMVQISGIISHQDGGMIAGTTVELEGSESGSQITNENGTYAFTALAGGNYQVVPVKDGDDGAGVTTLDLILIQKHLLALKELESPYDIIAADVDNNGKVSAADLYTLRQLILGVTEAFSKTDSWTFIDKAYSFANPFNPLNEAFPKTSALNNATQDAQVDFVGIKMGDINHSITLDGGQDIKNRSVDALQLAVEEQQFTEGELIEIPVYADNFNELNGFQMTLHFDNTRLEFAEIQQGALQMNSSNLGLSRVGNGDIAISWSEANPVSAGMDDILFSVHFRAIKTSNISESLSINNNITSIEAYNSEMDVIDVKFNVRNAEETEFTLYQNTPNPFSNETTISFTLPEAGMATLTIQDVTGRVLKSITGEFVKGMNNIQISKSGLDALGILYYQLESAGNTATRKMVVLQ